MRKKKISEVKSILSNSNYDIIDDDADYKYLVRLPMDSVTEENVEKILKEKEMLLSEISILEKKSENMIWIEELENLREAYLKYKGVAIAVSDSVAKTVSGKKRKLKLKSKQ